MNATHIRTSLLSCRAVGLVFLVLGVSFFLMRFFATPAHAALGDCSQPVSTGSRPATGDCLRILRVAVGSATCTPACICAPKGTLPTTTTDALLCLRNAVGQNVPLECPCTTLDGDDFDDNSKNPALWSADDFAGSGILNETEQVLQYTAVPGTPADYATRRWIAGRMPYATDWEVQIDIANSAVLANDNEFSSFGLLIFDDSDLDNEIYAELYNSQLGGPPARSGFHAELYDDDAFVDSVDTNGVDGLTTGALRIVFDAETAVITLFYDANSGDGYQWVGFGSFGVDGAAGEDANADWGMTGDGRFLVGVYGYSEQLSIPAGAMHGDNFQVTGAVVP